MSRKSRRRNKILAAMVGLAGASKLGILPKGSTVGMGSSDMYAKAAKARKAGLGVPKSGAGIATVASKVAKSALPAKRNMKSIFVGDDGTITKGLETFKNKEAYAKAMRKRRGETGVGLKSFLNKFILGPKAQLNMGGEAKVKTKLNGVLKTKTY